MLNHIFKMRNKISKISQHQGWLLLKWSPTVCHPYKSYSIFHRLSSLQDRNAVIDEASLTPIIMDQVELLPTSNFVFFYQYCHHHHCQRHHHHHYHCHHHHLHVTIEIPYLSEWKDQSLREAHVRNIQKVLSRDQPWRPQQINSRNCLTSVD